MEWIHWNANRRNGCVVVYSVGVAKCKCLSFCIHSKPKSSFDIFFSNYHRSCHQAAAYSLSHSFGSISTSTVWRLIFMRICPFHYYYHSLFDTRAKRTITITTNSVGCVKTEIFRDEQINCWNFNGVASMFVPRMRGAEWEKERKGERESEGSKRVSKRGQR